jgi:putative DNA primase/helicase
MAITLPLPWTKYPTNHLCKIKNFTTGDEVSVARKHGQHFNMKPFCKFVFSANALPKSSKDEGWYRRITIIPFTRRFKSTAHFDIDTVLHQDALDSLGSMAIDAYTELYQQSATDDSKWSNYEETCRYLEQYKEDSDSALSFINNFNIGEQFCVKRGEEVLISKSNLYQRYDDFCKDSNLKPKSKQSFGKTVKEALEDCIYQNTHCWILDEKRYTKATNPPKTKSFLNPLKPLVPLQPQKGVL